MISFGVFLLIIVSGTSGDTDSENLMERLDSRIVGGCPVSINEHPYQVAIEKNGKYWCGGSILNTKVILTAASCVKDFQSSDLQVRAGSSSIAENNGLTVKVASFKMYPKFTRLDHKNNVALIYLSSPLFYNEFIKNIKLSETTPPEGTKAHITGWGDAKNSKILEKADVTIIASKTCPVFSYVKGGTICAEPNGRGACTGDQGGPLVVNGRQVGIVTWSDDCALGKAGTYTNVAHYFRWISDNLNPKSNVHTLSEYLMDFST